LLALRLPSFSLFSPSLCPSLKKNRLLRRRRSAKLPPTSPTFSSSNAGRISSCRCRRRCRRCRSRRRRHRRRPQPKVICVRFVGLVLGVLSVGKLPPPSPSPLSTPFVSHVCLWKGFFSLLAYFCRKMRPDSLDSHLTATIFLALPCITTRGRLSGHSSWDINHIWPEAATSCLSKERERQSELGAGWGIPATSVVLSTTHCPRPPLPPTPFRHGRP